MSDTDTNGPSEKGDRFPPDGEKFPVLLSRREQYSGVYTTRWKDVCREIVRVYAQTGVEIYGKPLGSTRLRDKIMEGHGEGILSHTNIRDWLAVEEGGKGHPDDVTFSYIDEFVRKLKINDPIYARIRTKIAALQDEENRKFFVRNHIDRRSLSDPLLSLTISRLQGSLFISPMILNFRSTMPAPHGERHNRQIAIYLDFPDKFILKAYVIYSPRPFSGYQESRSISRQEIVVYRGYVAISSSPDSFLMGTIHLHRPEVAGLDRYQPYTVSEISIPNPDRLGRLMLMTNWASQILYPLSPPPPIESKAAPLDVDQFTFDLDKGVSQRAITPSGQIMFEKMHKNNDFLINYIKNLTDEYFIW